MTVEAAGPTGAVVAYDAPATRDDVDGVGIASCSPASGALFALGSTTVHCVAVDAHVNAARPTSFTVTVRDSTPPVASVPAWP